MAEVTDFWVPDFPRH